MSNQERVAERRKHWGELIARQQQSGKTVKAFCEENGVGGPSFYAWRKRLKGKIQPVGFALVETAAVGQQRGQAMEEGTYAMPFSESGEVRQEITAQELGALLSGIDLRQAKRRKRYRRTVFEAA